MAQLYPTTYPALYCSKYRGTLPTQYRIIVPTLCCRWYSYSEPSKTFLMMNVQDSVFQLFERYVKFHIFKVFCSKNKNCLELGAGVL
jgi:hypothetical protein